MSACRTCELVARRDAGEAPPWDSILRTPHWDIVHAYGTGIEGWMVLVVRRHITAIAEMTESEALELGPLVKSVSAALHDVVGCVKTYVAQFAEHEDHPHVHVHVIPRLADQSEDWSGPRIFSQLGLPDEFCVTEARMNALAAAIAPKLSLPSSSSG